MNTNTENYPVPKNARVLVLNMSEDRSGSENDVAKIQETFEGFPGYRVTIVENFTANDIKRKDRTFARFKSSLVKEEVDALFVFVMAHGGPKSSIHVSNGGIINFKKDILRRFSREETPELSHIPKCFVVNACRGNGRFSPSWGDSIDCIPGTEIRSFDNILVLYSTQEGLVSSRGDIMGSYYIQVLCDFFSKYAATKHLMDIVAKTSSEVKTTTGQIPQNKDYGWGFFFFTQQAKDVAVSTNGIKNETPLSSNVVVPAPLHHAQDQENRDGGDEIILRIADLLPGQNIKFNQNKTKLYARLLYKVKVDTAHDKSECYKFLLADNSNEFSEIEAVAFNATGLIFYTKLDIGSCVVITEAKIEYKPDEFLNFGLTKNVLQMKLFNYHGMDIIPEKIGWPKYPKMTLTALKDVQHKRHRSIIDVIGIVVKFNPNIVVTLKYSTYRELILRDHSDGTYIPFTMWGMREDVTEGALVYIRDVRVIKPSQINANGDDDSPDDYEIKTDHHSVSQQSVLVEINEIIQVDPTYRATYVNHFSESDGEPRKKIARNN